MSNSCDPVKMFDEALIFLSELLQIAIDNSSVAPGYPRKIDQLRNRIRHWQTVVIKNRELEKGKIVW